jgi:hypothetical protein
MVYFFPILEIYVFLTMALPGLDANVLEPANLKLKAKT